jgi:hypothetical protein
MCPEDGSSEAPRLWRWAVPDAICQLPELKLSCFGCCGYDWAPIERLKKQVAMNTWRFTKMYSSKETFAETTIGVTEVGICKGVIQFDDGSVGCPLHPKRNDGNDLRSGDCLRNYECNALRHYKKWTKERRLEYLEHIAKGNYDTYTYSIANANNSVIVTFLEATPTSYSSRLKDLLKGDRDE